MKTILKQVLLLGTLTVLLLASVFAWYRLNRFAAVLAPAPPPAYSPLNLARPDALVVTQSLSQLPREIVKAPLLKEWLDEDFVFHYEYGEDRLNLVGTLRRIAYEHELSFGDELLAYVFDTPAHLALWKGHDGALNHYLLLIDRSGLVKALETVAKIALDDEQLKVRDEITLTDGAKLTVYELKYGYRRSLFFADHRGALLVFSDAGLLLPAEPEKRAAAAQFLAQAQPHRPFLERFKLDGLTSLHTLVASAEYLSFGYQRFFPALEAVRFDLTPTGWTSAAWLTGMFPGAEALWKAVPTGPALCVAVPVQAATLTDLLRAISPGEDGQRLLQALEPPAAVCWYHRSRLYTPLVLIKTDRGVAPALLKTLFEKTVGSPEAALPAPTPGAELPPVTGATPASDVSTPTPPAANPPIPAPATTAPLAPPRQIRQPPFAVSERPCPGGTIWRREVSSRYGAYPAATSPNAGFMRSSRFFAVTLAHCEQTLIFSPDDTLIDRAVAVLAQRYPAVADALPSGLDPAVVIFPPSLADLLETELRDSLPEAQEPVFRASVARYLLPQLEKSKKFPAHALVLPAGATGWVPIRWQALAAP